MITKTNMHKKKHSRRKLTHRKSGKKLKLKQCTANPSYPNIAYFPISDENVTTMKRFIASPRDCVINALELLKIADPNVSAILRIMVGETGVSIPQIQKLFEYLYRRPFAFEGHPISNLPVLGNILVNGLPVNNAIFMGIKYSTGDGHVFIVAKNIQGDIVYLDPQKPILCNLYTKECETEVFGNAVEFFLLRYGDYNTLQPIVSNSSIPMDLSS